MDLLEKIGRKVPEKMKIIDPDLSPYPRPKMSDMRALHIDPKMWLERFTTLYWILAFVALTGSLCLFAGLASYFSYGGNVPFFWLMGILGGYSILNMAVVADNPYPKIVIGLLELAIGGYFLF